MPDDNRPTIGSLFAGIGGFDAGFEAAGFRTAWQVELDPLSRAVLAHRFPDARRHTDVRECGARNLEPVSVLAAGFPCQDISNSGSSKRGGKLGLRGERSGLFHEVMRIIDEIQPPWVVLENVKALLHSNHCEDIQVVVQELAKRNYVGYARVLDAQHFGSTTRRERIFLVAGRHRYPPMEFLSDAAPVKSIPSSFVARGELWCPADVWAGYTLQASNTHSRISIGAELLVAEENGWDQMVERQRTSESHGLCLGLDEANLAEAKGAGNAVCPQVAQWIAEKLIKEMR